MVLLEVAHFVALASAGNHRCLEQLFLSVPRFETVWWKQLAAQLDLFRGKQAVEHLLGVAKGLVGTPGKARLALRLVMQCESLVLHNVWHGPLSDAERQLLRELDESNPAHMEMLRVRVGTLEDAKKALVMRNTTAGRNFLMEHGLSLRMVRK